MQRLGHADFAAALTFAGRLARRAAKRIQKERADTRVHQLDGAGSRRVAFKGFGFARCVVQRIQQLLRAQALDEKMGVIPGIALISRLRL